MLSLKNNNLSAVLIILCLASFSFSGEEPKNIVIMIADGCGFEHVEACDVYSGDKGVYESFAVKIAMSTFASGQGYDALAAWNDRGYVKKNATDSAAAATAMACGVKTYKGAIGVDVDKRPVENVLEAAEKIGKSTGVITTVAFSHATPAGFVAHNGSRNNYKEIADEMINESALEVIIGSGHPFYNDSGKWHFLPQYKYIGTKTFKSLKASAAGSDCDGDGIADPWEFIDKKKDFLRYASGETPKRIFGLCQTASTLQQKRGGDKKAGAFETPANKNLPCLADMARVALNVLDNNPAGFVLMIEGGAVDWAGHKNQSGRLIEEMVDFNIAVGAVLEWAKTNKGTLLIVTADHETGYLAVDAENSTPGQMPKMTWSSSGHTNSLVPFYATGPGADIFAAMAIRDDPVYGKYLDNTDIAKMVLKILAAGRAD